MLRSIIHFTLWLTSKCISIAYIPILCYYKMKEPKRCPAAYNDIYFLPANVLTEKIRQQELSSTYIVQAYIKRVKEVNPILNAVVEDRYEEAMKEAKHVDEFIKTSNLSPEELKRIYPLLGVPITIKESTAVEGMSNNAGSYAIKEIKAKEDADCVRQVKAAGAIIILVSNTPEMCLNWETFNHVTGRTLNPYDTRRSCGGSSGGEAVLVATCASIIGVGSDLVGSVRLPPALCGVFGHRPSPGLISTKGNIPFCHQDSEIWRNTFTFGPITRFASDLPLLLDILIKPEKKGIINLFQEMNPKEIKITYMLGSGDDSLTTPVSPEIQKAILKVIGVLKENNFITKKIDVKELEDSVDLTFLPLFEIDVSSVFDYKTNSIFEELIRTIFCCATVTPTAIFSKLFKMIFKIFITPERVLHNKYLIELLKEVLIREIGVDGVFIYPTVPEVANFHGEIYSRTMDTSYMGIFTILGFPVTVCPVGLNKDGLPIGIQVISVPNNDRLCLTIARQIEMYCGGWVSPPYALEPPNEIDNDL